MDSPLVWSILLMLFGLALVVLEVFLPSGGILGFLSVSSLVAAIGMAFYNYGSETGLIFVGVAAVSVPTVVAVAFKWWPHTPMGKRLLLDLPKSEDVLPDSPLRRSLRKLVGRVGVAKSVMLPSGAVLVDGMTVDALSEGVPIEPGQTVRVVAVRGNRVVVRPDDEARPAKGNDVLSQSIESLGLDPFEDPLA